MRTSLLRTISGRIVLGFVVLLAALGSVSAYTVLKMRQMGHDLAVIRTAYLEVSLRVAQLQLRQGQTVDYLNGPSVERPYAMKYRDLRRVLLLEAEKQIKELGEPPAGWRGLIDQIEGKIRLILGEFDKDGPNYEAAFAAHDPEARRAALDKVRRSESHLQREINDWFSDLKNDALLTTLRLEQAERQARLEAIGLGALAVLLGLLVTVWGVLTVRPLRRLRDGVRKVARGDYSERVAVAGGTEVADLAREFNSMAAAIEARQAELVRSERLAAVGKMAAVITHEVRNPLSSIGLNTELLEEELRRAGLDGEAVELCRSIQKEVDQLTGITEEYLRFARLPRPKLEREQVNSIITGLVEFQREDLSLRGVTVDAELASELPPVSADEAQLRQAFLNLLRNAADAMDGNGGGRVTIATHRIADGSVQIRVADSGPGIRAEHLARIFEPFFSTKEGGTGLGLALTHQIIAEHGGRIEVESTAGRGTTFVVTLPAAG